MTHTFTTDYRPGSDSDVDAQSHTTTTNDGRDDAHAAPMRVGGSASEPTGSSFDRWWMPPAVGAAVWALWAAIYTDWLGWFDWPTVALMFSPFVIVPLGLAIANRRESGPVSPTLCWLQVAAPLVAICPALSFFAPPGWQAATLTVPWLAFGGVAGAVGTLRSLSRPRFSAGVGIDAGLVFVGMGSIWVTTSRLGANPLGYDDLLVLLTAIHLHYAGFGLPLVAGFTSLRLQRSPTIVAAAIAAIPLTGGGVALGGVSEFLTATFCALVGLATAMLLMMIGAQSNRWGRWLVRVAALSLATAMVLGIGWAWSTLFGWDYLDILSMARLHGMLNAFGFGLLSLIGLNLVPEVANPPLHVIPRLRVASQRNLHVIAESARAHEPIAENGAATCANARTTDLPHGFDAAKDALLHWAGHAAAGIRLWPQQPEIREGETLALSTPIGPLAIVAALRITDVVDEPDRFGFTYAALPDHPEIGSQTMIVERTAEGTRLTVATQCGPRLMFAKMMPGVTLRMQDRIATRYLAGISEWTPRYTADSRTGQRAPVLGPAES